MKRFHSVLKRTRNFENRLYCALQQRCDSGHPCGKLPPLQLQLLFEVFLQEPVSLVALAHAVHLTPLLADVPLRELEGLDLIVEGTGRRQGLYQTPKGIHTLLEEMKSDLDALTAKLGFRVGELVLVEWDNILRIVDREMDSLEATLMKHDVKKEIEPTLVAPASLPEGACSGGGKGEDQ